MWWVYFVASICSIFGIVGLAIDVSWMMVSGVCLHLLFMGVHFLLLKDIRLVARTTVDLSDDVEFAFGKDQARVLHRVLNDPVVAYNTWRFFRGLCVLTAGAAYALWVWDEDVYLPVLTSSVVCWILSVVPWAIYCIQCLAGEDGNSKSKSSIYRQRLSMTVWVFQDAVLSGLMVSGLVELWGGESAASTISTGLLFYVFVHVVTEMTGVHHCEGSSWTLGCRNKCWSAENLYVWQSIFRIIPVIYVYVYYHNPSGLGAVSLALTQSVMVVLYWFSHASDC